MASRVSISNMALAELPANPIASMGEASLEARECTRVYDQCLQELLELHEWGFANRRIILAAVTNDRDSEWGYAYALPTGVGTPRRVLPDLTTAIGALPLPGPFTPPYYEVWGFSSYATFTDYIIENGVIYSNFENAMLEYGAATVAEAVMPALFVRALALEIASRIAMPIKKSRELKGDLIKQAEVAKDRAKADDLNRQPQRAPYYMTEMELARGGGC